MTMTKFTALLVMIAAYAAVDFAVPVKAIDFTEGNKFEPADTPSALPGTGDSDDKVWPLPTNTTVEVAEERVSPPKLDPTIFDHLLSSIKKLTNEPHIPASGAAAFDLNAKPLSGVLERTGKRVKVDHPSEDIDKLDHHLVPSGKTLDIHAVPHLSSEVELKSRAKDLQSAESSLTKPWTKRKWSDDPSTPQELELKMAFDIPAVPPSFKTIKGKEVLAHYMPGEQLTIPAENWKIGNSYLLRGRDLLLRQEAPDLEKWLETEDVFSKTADTIRETHNARLHLSMEDLNKFTYAFALNARDAHIRQSFPRWYSSVLRQAQVESALKSEYHLSGTALEYYMTEYSIFREFAKSFWFKRFLKKTLPSLDSLDGAMKPFGLDFKLLFSVLKRARKIAEVKLSDYTLKRLANYMQKPDIPSP